MQDPRRRFWVRLAVVAGLIGLLALALVPTGVARTAQQSERAIRVMTRTLTELLPSTPAGQYYRALAIRYNDEWYSIYFERHLERVVDVTFDSIDLFVPGMEALLDGHGQDVVVSAETAGALQAELDWLLTVASPELCADIDREMARFPPQDFVGLTYAQAWDHLNAVWTPDPAGATPTPQGP